MDDNIEYEYPTQTAHQFFHNQYLEYIILVKNTENTENTEYWT
jgi:hypothetical protein